MSQTETSEGRTGDAGANAALASPDFVRAIVADDMKSRRFDTVATRFPPEPNGYLHIGHAKAICLDFGIAQEFNGACNLRFDDTNPAKEETEYVESIMHDVRWLGFDWADRLYFASDYFEELYDYAVALVKRGMAYIDSLSAEQIREYRGTLTEPGRDSPYRTRTVEENLDLLTRMRAGEFPDGAHVLRARIDTASANLNMRDPVMYRILHATHHRTGDAWCLYPMYDWAHGLSDSLEGITHSICTLEYEDHRPLYDWFIEQLGVHHPRQIEFAPLNLSHTVMSKRKLLQLVNAGYVEGWDDPRLPTLAGLRRRGYTPEAIRAFIARIGVGKVPNLVDIALLEHCIREDSNRRSPRVMAVLAPLRVVIENYPDDQVEWFEADNNPEDPAAGTRKVPFSKVLFIEHDDFREEPPKKFYRLAPGREIRLKHAYYITCTQVRKNPDTGAIEELRCTYDPESRGGGTPDGRKVRGTSHWVSAHHALDAEIRLYEHLFAVRNPAEHEDPTSCLNPDSLTILEDCKVEPSLANAAPGDRFQFLRQGYFCVDTKGSRPDRLVFNRTVSLRDTWAKLQKARSG